MVCSDHFENGKPSLEHPLPTLCLGYNIAQQLGCAATSKPRQHRSTVDTALSASQPLLLSSSGDVIEPSTTTLTLTNSAVENFPSSATEHNIYPAVEESNSSIDVKPRLDNATWDIDDITSASNKTAELKKQLHSIRGQLASKCMQLRTKSFLLRQQLQPMYKLLLKSDTDTHFYTGIPKAAIFFDCANTFVNLRDIKVKNCLLSKYN